MNKKRISIPHILKKKITHEDPKTYSSWIIAFPSLLEAFVKEGRIVTDQSAQEVLASRHKAFGPFSSIDEFWFWALDDRHLPLEQIIHYLRDTQKGVAGQLTRLSTARTSAAKSPASSTTARNNS
jgi:hypothetical protein